MYEKRKTEREETKRERGENMHAKMG